MSGSVQQALPGNYDAQLKMSSVVSDFDECITRYRSLSLETRKVINRHVECSYGASALERVDVFLPDSISTSRRIHVFFHGGYWRAFDKSDYSFVARPIVDTDSVAIVANYGLLPSISMRQLIAQCRTVICWLHTNAFRFNASPDRISISGHSAGAHIAAILSLTRWAEHNMPDDIIKSTLAVSGIYDLEPILHSFLRAETCITAEDVARFSPVNWVDRDRRSIAPLFLAVGEEETDEFQRQSTVFAQTLSKHALDVSLQRIAHRHHMNVVLDLGDSQAELGRKLVEIILAT